jgi:hypothetical protein
VTATDAFFVDTRPAGELPDVPTEIPRHRGKGKQPWIRRPDDTGPPPAVATERHRDGSMITVLADPKDGPRGFYAARASEYGGPLEDKHKIYAARERRIAWAFGRHPELVMASQALGEFDAEREALEELARRANEYARGDAAASRGTSFHRLRERRDAGEDLSYLDPLTLQGLATWERLLQPFELIGSEQFVVNDELQAAGTYDALLQLTRPITIRHPKTGEVLDTLQEGEAVVGDLKSGKWGPDWFGPTYLCQAYVYATGQPYAHQLGRYLWVTKPSARWAVIPYVSLDNLGAAGLHWIDLTRAARAVEAVRTIKEIRGDRLNFVAHTDEPMPADLRAAGERATLLDQIAGADGKVALSRLWALNTDVWTPEHTAAGQARLAQLAGGAS